MCRFYTGSLILALQALHEKCTAEFSSEMLILRKIIYRDLKPENVRCLTPRLGV